MFIHPEVADALTVGRAVVALESTIISHGLPRPDNLRIAREIEAAVRAGGAIPATVAIGSGVAWRTPGFSCGGERVRSRLVVATAWGVVAC